MYKIIHIANNRAYSDNPITQAFRNKGFEVVEVDLFGQLFEKRVTKQKLLQDIFEVGGRMQPNFIFMQVQHEGIINEYDATCLNNLAPLISYSGDVRNNTDWHQGMGRAGALTILNNDDDIETLRLLGYKAEYLQIGFHHQIHNPKFRFDNEIGRAHV